MPSKSRDLKVYISIDMEGISGIVDWDQVDPRNREYERYRRLMVGDLNAAIEGVLEAGVDEAVVADSHGHMRNHGLKMALKALEEFKPFRVKKPVEVRMRSTSSMMADVAALIPNAERVDGRTIRIVLEDYLTAFRGLRTAIAVAYPVEQR